MSRKRAASLALQMKGFDNKGMKDDDIKAKNISPLFCNVDSLQKNSNVSEKKITTIIPVLELNNQIKMNDYVPPSNEHSQCDVEGINDIKQEDDSATVLPLSATPEADFRNDLSDVHHDKTRLSYENHVECETFVNNKAKNL